MARVDYHQIGKDIETVLKAEPTLEGVRFQRTYDPAFGQGDFVQILLRRRDAPDGMQGINARTRKKMLVRYSIICWAYGLNADIAEERRDDLVGRVEIALLNNYTSLESKLGGPNWDGGGNFYGNDEPFWRGAEIEFTVEATAVSA